MHKINLKNGEMFFCSKNETILDASKRNGFFLNHSCKTGRCGACKVNFIGKTKVEAVEVSKIKLGEPDSSGRRRPEIQAGSEYKVKADLVIKSLGFDPENLPKLFNASELAISQWGTIKIDLKTMQTNLDGVFAAGDIVRGASLVVWAIRDGRDAAAQIEKYLKLKDEKRKSVEAA